MTEPIQPIVPEGTPLPTPPVGVPPFPITPFAVWTWSSPVIPEFYWNVYSSEQRIKQICKEIGKIEAYLNYLTNKVNENIIEIHKRIDALTERVAALEKKVEEEVARLDALIAKLREDLEQEIQDRQDADEALGERIDQEVIDRTHGDDVLHQEISKETQDRIHADDQLHQEISQETQAREDADTALETRLTAAIAQRLLPTDVTAGDEISITRPDPSSNRIVIASTVAHSISELETSISGLQSALEAEVSERRADDTKLWAAVNNRIERGKILAGAGIKVENDPDASTVTISATGGGTGGGSTTIEAGSGIKVETEGGTSTVSLATPYPTVQGTAPVTVQATSSTTPGASTGTTYTVGVSAATDASAGIITESRVKELAGSVAPSLSAEAPLKLEEGTLSLTKDPAGPVTSSAAGLSVREITPETESETEAGVVSKKTIKSLAASGGAYPGLATEGGLKEYVAGGIGVSLGYKEGSSLYTDYNPIGVSPEGFLMLTGGSYKLISGTETIGLTNYRSRDLTAIFIRDVSPTSDTGRAVFSLPTGYFEVRNGKGAWQDAESGAFELFAEASRVSPYTDNKNFPIYHQLYVRFTPRGRAFYSPDTSDTDPESSAANKITDIRVTYAVYNLYILPTKTE